MQRPEHQTRRIDLNADLGETEGDALPLLPLITSANVAGGGHAGGGTLLRVTVAAATEAGIQIGAHPSYPDRDNFGRTSLWGQIHPDRLAADVAKQILLVAAEVQAAGSQLSHVKAHGALYNDMMKNAEISELFLRVMSSLYPAGLPVFGMPGSALEELAHAARYPFVTEGFMDRAYVNSAQLSSRTQLGSVLNESAARAQALQIATRGSVTALDGNTYPLGVSTICVHADTPGAAQTLVLVRDDFLRQGIAIASFDSKEQ